MGWALVVLRLTVILGVLLIGLVLTLVLRLAEAPLCGARRPVTPWITVAVCRIVLRCFGLRHELSGPSITASFLVANHVSWLDIFVLNATGPLYFVAKSEVASWPGIGWLAKATGTAFVIRDPRQSMAQAAMLRDRLTAGHRLVLFPEGTSTDGQRVVTFRSSMFGAAVEMGAQTEVQPISLVYTAPNGTDRRFYGWWGDMDMAPHLLQVLGTWRQGSVQVIRHRPLRVGDFPDRKALAVAAEGAVRRGVTATLGASGV